MKTRIPLRFSLLSAAAAALIPGAHAWATEFQTVGSALKTILGTDKVFKKSFGAGKDIFYSKDDSGRPSKLAMVQHGLYKPSCTHTWVIGLDAATDKVTGIEVVEMSCPHAFPTREQSYLSQYVGKGPADAKSLDKQIDTIAKATGSCNLVSEAVSTTINDAVRYRSGM